MTSLLDANVLVARTQEDHTHHGAAIRWFHRSRRPFATCSTTQGALLRHLLRQGACAPDARAVLQALVDQPGHEFWADDLSYLDVRLAGVVGHRQVTDAYLAARARSRAATMATFDRGLAALHPDVAELIATE